MSEETQTAPDTNPADVKNQAMAALVAEQSEKVRRRTKPAKNKEAEASKPAEEEVSAEGDPQPEEPPVTQRQRGKMTNKKPHNSSYKGVPTDLIVEAMEFYPTLDIKVSRISPRGTRSSLGRFNKTPQELCDIDIWLKDAAGGGRFHIEALKMGEPGRAEPIPAFEFEIEGTPKAFKGSDIDNSTSSNAPYAGPFGFMGNAALAAGPQPSAGMQPSVDQKILPAYIRGLPQSHQVAYAQQHGLPMQYQHPNQAPANAYASDQIAAQELERAREELAEERKRHEREKAEERARWEMEKAENKKRELELAERLTRIEQQRMEDQRRASEERHALELERIRADQARDREQFQQMLQQHSEKKPTPSLLSSPELLATLGTLVTTLLSNSSERQFRSLEMQQKQQQQLMATMAASRDQKPMMDTIKAVAPLMVPLLSAIWESKSPKAQSDLVATMAENQLTSISMMAELINSFGAGQQEPPFWLPMAQETLKGVVQAAEAMANKNKPAQPAQLPQPVAQVPVQNAPNPQQVQQAQQMANQLAPEQIAQLIFSDPRYPEWGRTEEWKQALILLHSESPDAAPYIATLLRTLDDKGTTPPEIEGVWENATEVLQQIIMPMPIWQMNNTYAVSVINGIIDILTEDGDDGQPHVAVEPPPDAQVVEPPRAVTVDTTGEVQPYPVAEQAG